MIRLGSTEILLLVLLLAPALQAQFPDQQPAQSLPVGWENVAQKLWATIPDYEHDEKWYNRRVGTIHVDTTNGDLYVMVCGKWGTWKSSDQGATWTQVDATALGRQVENRGVCANPATGDFVLFKVDGGPPAQSAIVLDHGRTWLPVTSNVGDGFRCGIADWSDSPPRNLLAIRHHHDGLYLSEDSGKTWVELPRKGGCGAAMFDPETILLAFLKSDGSADPGTAVPKWRAKSMPKEIKLSTDRCRTFVKVAEFNPACETPTRHGDSLYWIAAEGVMVSGDRGRSWQRLGQPIRDLIYGPFFGTEHDTMIVVTRTGFYQTTDAGQQWAKVADIMVPGGQQLQNAHPAWDPVHNVIYIAFLGDDVYRRQLSPRGTSN